MSWAASFFSNKDELAELLARFARVRVAVVGDFFLDRYLVIDPSLDEASIETSLTARQVVAIRNSPGAAGTVVNNLVALGCGKILAIGVIGDDAYGYELGRELYRRGVDASRLIRSPDRFTPTYTKPMLRLPEGERELERLDVINRTPTPAELEDRILYSLDQTAPQVDAVIVLDQVVAANCGVVTERVRARLADLARRHAKTLFFADSRAFISHFAGVTIKVNQHEALRAAGLEDAEEPALDALLHAGNVLRQRTGKPVFVTRGAKGILVVTDLGKAEAPAPAVEGPIDVVGAGDSVTAGVVLSLCAGATLPQAAFVGNLVASITVEVLGSTGTASPSQVLERYEKLLQ